MGKILMPLGRVAFIDRSTTPDTVYPVAVVRDCSIEFSKTTKTFDGDDVMAEEMIDVGAKITFKMKFAKVYPEWYLAAFPGATSAAGSDVPVFRQAVTVPATPFSSVPAEITGGATFKDDLGVEDSSGNLLARVTGTPATGQYVLTDATGTYLFAEADVGLVYYRSFSYHTASAGKTITVTTWAKGKSTLFELVVFAQNTRAGKSNGYRFYAVGLSKNGEALKAEDFGEGDVDGEAIKDATSGKTFDRILG